MVAPDDYADKSRADKSRGEASQDDASRGNARLKTLRWKSRRGMKELDVLLEAFLIQQATALKEGKWPVLEEFLAQEDDVLFDWISGRDLPVNNELVMLIDQLTHVS